MSFKILVAPKSGFLVPEDHPAWMKCLMDDVCHEFFGLTSTHPPPHLHHQDTPSPPAEHFQTNPTVFPPQYLFIVTTAASDILLPRP